MKKTIAAILLAATVASPAPAERGGKGRGGERHERAGYFDGGRGYFKHSQRAQRAERSMPQFERRAAKRGDAGARWKDASRNFARAEPRNEARRHRKIERSSLRAERAIARAERRSRGDIERVSRSAAFERVRRDSPRNWGQMRSAIAHRENAERRVERARGAELSRNHIAYYVSRPRDYRVVETVRYAQPAYYRQAAYAPDYADYSDYGGQGFGDSLLGAALPLLLGSSLGDFGGVGSLGLLESVAPAYAPTYAYADPYAYSYAAPAAYGYADPYVQGVYDYDYAEPWGLSGEAGSLAQLASLALGSGFLGGDLGALGGLGGYGPSGYDPLSADPQALIAQAALGSLIG